MKPQALKCIQELVQGDLNSSPSNSLHSRFFSKEYSPMSFSTPRSLASQKVHKNEFSQELSSNLSKIEIDNSTKDSVLSLAMSKNIVFSGSQNGYIYVWDRVTFKLIKKIKAHNGGIMCLTLGENNSLLLSGSCDSVIKAWDTITLKCKYQIVAGRNSGTIFSIVYSSKNNCIFLGCQNTTIQWLPLYSCEENSIELQSKELMVRNSNFFEGTGNPGISVDSLADYFTNTNSSLRDLLLLDYDSSSEKESILGNTFMILPDTIIKSAHFGSVSCILEGKMPNCDSLALFSGSSDGTVKIWEILPSSLRLLDTLIFSESCELGILTIAIDNGLLYAGMEEGAVVVWDLETKQIMRTLEEHSDDVHALSIHNNFIFSASSDGFLCVWSSHFDLLLKILAHESRPILSLTVSPRDGVIITGSSENSIKFWMAPSDISMFRDYRSESYQDSDDESYISFIDQGSLSRKPARDYAKSRPNYFLYCLDDWIAFKSVSGSQKHQQECRNAAIYLRDLASSLGASSAKLLASTSGKNPLVYFRFDSNTPVSKNQPKFNCDTPTILIYGHYDVVPIRDLDLWDSDPFSLTGKNGYLYGRGVTDNKGPVLAMLFAVYDLYVLKQLPISVVFLIEGEEECSGNGLKEAVELNKSVFGKPKLILLSLSYWLGENVPCLTYGMRGHLKVKLHMDTSRKTDVHSGVWGGAVIEPLLWLSRIISAMSDPNGKILLPGFYDSVCEISQKEDEMLKNLIKVFTKNELGIEPEPENGFNKTPSRAMRLDSSFLEKPDLLKIPLDKNENQGKSNATENDLAIQNKMDTVYRQLVSRWRTPSLTVHRINILCASYSATYDMVPPAAEAAFSIRIVPNQSSQAIMEAIDKQVGDTLSEIVKNMQHRPDRYFRIKDSRELRGNILYVSYDLLMDYSDENPTSLLSLNVQIENVADWWVGDTEHPYYQLAKKAVIKEWESDSSKDVAGPHNQKDSDQNPSTSSSQMDIEDANSGHTEILSQVEDPFLAPANSDSKIAQQPDERILYIREGGSIPAVPWFERYFGKDCVIINLPMGQSSDNAHLPNERIKLINLIKGRNIVRNIVSQIN
ncbi:hypothetical protein BB560_000618 [Smittium megazygosporum]|uniref:Peptidase M20 dimerisation domain-containing protein n=1 Tax=Smittium megazygosporum TaxID=133381 RepID=A0A2T9ZJZ1_9FUNG|nr:hypothetical protein BB560_000618 [Smittium megazygosporum]